jgi:hypothetical protein
MDGQTAATLYAAIVATGALALEVRRWFESGPKIHVTASPDMIMIYGRKEVSGLLLVNVINRGHTPTTITHFAILEYPNALKRWRNDPAHSFLIPHPQPEGSPPSIPHVLEPGRQWTGVARPRPDVTGDIQTGTFWAAIYTTDRKRPYLAHIRRKTEAKELVEAKEV